MDDDMTPVDIAVARAIATLEPELEQRLESEPQAHLDLVVVTADARRSAGRLLQSAVDSARAAGWSWASIGEVLDMSRQAAQQRFGHPADPLDDHHDDHGDVRRLVGLSAFKEMAALEEWGRHGWHSIGFGPLFHDVEKSDVQWEHRRVLAGLGSAPELIDDGWERVGSLWFPWVYLKRATDRPAEPGEPS